MDVKHAMTKMLERTFPLANRDQLARGTEQLYRIVQNERRRAAYAERNTVVSHLNDSGNGADVPKIKELPYE